MTDYNEDLESGPSYGQFVNTETGSPGDDEKQRKPKRKRSKKIGRKLDFTGDNVSAPKQPESICEGVSCSISGGRRSRKRRKRKTRKRKRKTRKRKGGKICFSKKCREKRRSNRKTKKIYTKKYFETPTYKSSDTGRMTDLAVSAKIAAALKNVDDKSFSDDAIDLLQSLHSTANEEEEEGLNESDLKLIDDPPIKYTDNPMFRQQAGKKRRKKTRRRHKRRRKKRIITRRRPRRSR